VNKVEYAASNVGLWKKQWKR